MAYHYLWPEVQMLHLIVNWFVSALALWLVAQIIPGIKVRDFGAALIATIAIAIVNATIGPVLKFLTFPITFLTLGLFLLVLNAFLLKLASLFTPGFAVRGFWSAVAGSLVLTILTAILRHIVFLPGHEWTGPLWNTL
jgi:putative membrane protein